MEAIALPNPGQIVHEGGHKYTLTLEPIYPGYGVTIGNALRRVLLSSMPGAAVTGVKIKFVDHEFSTIPNVKEDVIQIVLNLKQLRLKSFSAQPVKLFLKAKGERVVTAADIKETSEVQIINKDLHLATLDNKNADLDMELIVEQGRGYVPVEARENQKQELGMLSIDAIFTSIKSVFFDVTNVRVGQLTNFDKLSVTMETDGTIGGEEAVDIAAHILVDHFSMLFRTNIGQTLEDTASVANAEAAELNQGTFAEPAVNVPEIIGTPLDDLQLSNRAKNALKKNQISTLEQIEGLSTEAIRQLSGLGEKSVLEILSALKRTES